MNTDFEKLSGPLERLLVKLDLNFDRLAEGFKYLQPEVREFVDATSGAQSRYLPDGNSPLVKDYFYAKTDASANAVTIYPAGTQTIAGAASTALAAQYNNVTLIFDRGSQTWYIK